eukprot:3520794-Rhodomonas_salina.4
MQCEILSRDSDRHPTTVAPSCLAPSGPSLFRARSNSCTACALSEAVSYTHLTLPTICSV